APMKLNNLTESSFTLPKLLQKNFAIANSDNSIRLKSTAPVSTREELRVVPLPSGEQLCAGKLSEKDISSEPLSLTVPRSNKIGPFATLDRRPGSNRPDYIVEKIRLVDSPRPKKLVVVLDGSVCMQEHWNDIIDTLSALSHSSIPDKQLIVASSTNDANLEAVKLESAIGKLKKSNFTGGRDNLRALVKGSDLAGESAGSTLVWLHGPQPSFNSEMYLMESFVARPSFYEMSVGDQWTNLQEFFKNHKEIGPFVSIPRSGSMASDITKLVHNWKNGKSYSVELAHVFNRPDCEMVSQTSGDALMTLWANERVKQLAAASRVNSAAELASHYRLVTPLTACVVLDRGNSDSTGSSQAVANRLKLSNETATMEANAVGTQMPAQYEDQSERLSDAQGRISSSSSSSNDISNEAQLTARTSASQESDETGATPIVQSATNGTIGPQGVDATYVTGVNTAGTVRVNNLANLEALLNIMANGIEILGLFCGIGYLLKALCSVGLNGSRATAQTRIFQNVAVGLSCIVAGLLTPGFINWMVASARDANLFS
ncbi:MAG TPA: hypothetical protein V6C72_10515, partial [Chroococcales cyanobacterium]